MPDTLDQYRDQPAAVDPLGQFKNPASTASPLDEFKAPETTDSGSGWGKTALELGGAAAAAGGAYLLHDPEAASAMWSGAKRIGNELMDARGVSMLSGLASLKSMLGNAGTAVYSSIEHGTTAPLREMFSGDTLNEFKDAWKAGAGGAHYADISDAAPTIASKANVFGRFMGALDTASQSSLVRAGTHTPDQAAAEMLQRPLPHWMATALDNPVMRYAMPFRKTPVNQFLEGANTLGSSFKPGATMGQHIANAASVGQGLVTGYNTDDPTATALSISAGGKRGFGVATGDVLGRMLKGESGNKAAQGMQGMSPVADSSLGKSVTQVADPLSMYKPAALSAMDKLLTMFGR